jgi:hypothetical protein
MRLPISSASDEKGRGQHGHYRREEFKEYTRAHMGAWHEGIHMGAWQGLTRATGGGVDASNRRRGSAKATEWLDGEATELLGHMHTPTRVAVIKSRAGSHAHAYRPGFPHPWCPYPCARFSTHGLDYVLMGSITYPCARFSTHGLDPVPMGSIPYPLCKTMQDRPRDGMIS